MPERIPAPPAADLRFLGWDALWEEAAEPYRIQGLGFGRIVVERRESYVLTAAGGDRDAEVSGRFLFEAEAPADFPKVGDWVALTDYPREAKAVIHAVLPRRTKLSRHAAGKRTEEQILAANIDTIFLVQGLDFDFNVRRLERQMVMARESGAEPVVLLNKADLCSDAEARLAEAREAIPGSEVLAVTALASSGLDALRAFLRPARTHLLIGSSGVGKSTLINALVGRDLLATAPVRADDSKGRHTTTRRELVVLPGGALLIDTPGVREFGLWEADEAVGDVFADIDALALECRFTDCAHVREDGCSVLAAVASGALPAGRLESYRKLRKELAFRESKLKEKPGSDKKEWTKAIHKSMKTFRKLDPKTHFRD